MCITIERDCFKGIGTCDCGDLVSPKSDGVCVWGDVDSRLKTQKELQFKFKGSLLENKDKPVFQMKSKSSLLENSFLLRGGQSFVPFN